jgi:hypothetical protein
MKKGIVTKRYEIRALRLLNSSCQASSLGTYNSKATAIRIAKETKDQQVYVKEIISTVIWTNHFKERP